MKKLENVSIKRQPGIRPALVLRLKCLGSSFPHKKHSSNHEQLQQIMKLFDSKDRFGPEEIKQKI